MRSSMIGIILQFKKYVSLTAIIISFLGGVGWAVPVFEETFEDSTLVLVTGSSGWDMTVTIDEHPVQKFGNYCAGLSYRDDALILQKDTLNLGHLQLPDEDSLYLGFELKASVYHNYEKSHTTGFIVEVSTDGGATWNQEFNYIPTDQEWERVYVSLDGYRNNAILTRVRVNGYTTPWYDAHVYIDDIRVERKVLNTLTIDLSHPLQRIGTRATYYYERYKKLDENFSSTNIYTFSQWKTLNGNIFLDDPSRAPLIGEVFGDAHIYGQFNQRPGFSLRDTLLFISGYEPFIRNLSVYSEWRATLNTAESGMYLIEMDGLENYNRGIEARVYYGGEVFNREKHHFYNNDTTAYATPVYTQQSNDVVKIIYKTSNFRDQYVQIRTTAMNHAVVLGSTDSTAGIPKIVSGRPSVTDADTLTVSINHEGLYRWKGWKIVSGTGSIVDSMALVAEVLAESDLVIVAQFDMPVQNILDGDDTLSFSLDTPVEDTLIKSLWGVYPVATSGWYTVTVTGVHFARIDVTVFKNDSITSDALNKVRYSHYMYADSGDSIRVMLHNRVQRADYDSLIVTVSAGSDTRSIIDLDIEGRGKVRWSDYSYHRHGAQFELYKDQKYSFNHEISRGFMYDTVFSSAGGIDFESRKGTSHSFIPRTHSETLNVKYIPIPADEVSDIPRNFVMDSTLTSGNAYSGIWCKFNARAHTTYRLKATGSQYTRIYFYGSDSLYSQYESSARSGLKQSIDMVFTSGDRDTTLYFNVTGRSQSTISIDVQEFNTVSVGTSVGGRLLGIADDIVIALGDQVALSVEPRIGFLFDHWTASPGVLLTDVTVQNPMVSLSNSGSAIAHFSRPLQEISDVPQLLTVGDQGVHPRENWLEFIPTSPGIYRITAEAQSIPFEESITYWGTDSTYNGGAYFSYSNTQRVVFADSLVTFDFEVTTLAPHFFLLSGKLGAVSKVVIAELTDEVTLNMDVAGCGSAEIGGLWSVPKDTVLSIALYPEIVCLYDTVIVNRGTATIGVDSLGSPTISPHEDINFTVHFKRATAHPITTDSLKVHFTHSAIDSAAERKILLEYTAQDTGTVWFTFKNLQGTPQKTLYDCGYDINCNHGKTHQLYTGNKAHMHETEKTGFTRYFLLHALPEDSLSEVLVMQEDPFTLSLDYDMNLGNVQYSRVAFKDLRYNIKAIPRSGYLFHTWDSLDGFLQIDSVNKSQTVISVESDARIAPVIQRIPTLSVDTSLTAVIADSNSMVPHSSELWFEYTPIDTGRYIFAVKDNSYFGKRQVRYWGTDTLYQRQGYIQFQEGPIDMPFHVTDATKKYYFSVDTESGYGYLGYEVTIDEAATVHIVQSPWGKTAHDTLVYLRPGTSTSLEFKSNTGRRFVAWHVTGGHIDITDSTAPQTSAVVHTHSTLEVEVDSMPAFIVDETVRVFNYGVDGFLSGSKDVYTRIWMRYVATDTLEKKLVINGSGYASFQYYGKDSLFSRNIDTESVHPSLVYYFTPDSVGATYYFNVGKSGSNDLSNIRISVENPLPIYPVVVESDSIVRMYLRSPTRVEEGTEVKADFQLSLGYSFKGWQYDSVAFEETSQSTNVIMGRVLDSVALSVAYEKIVPISENADDSTEYRFVTQGHSFGSGKSLCFSFTPTDTGYIRIEGGATQNQEASLALFLFGADTSYATSIEHDYIFTGSLVTVVYYALSIEPIRYCYTTYYSKPLDSFYSRVTAYGVSALVEAEVSDSGEVEILGLNRVSIGDSVMVGAESRGLFDFLNWDILSGDGIFSDAAQDTTWFYPTEDSEVHAQFTVPSATPIGENPTEFLVGDGQNNYYGYDQWMSFSAVSSTAKYILHVDSISGWSPLSMNLYCNSYTSRMAHLTIDNSLAYTFTVPKDTTCYAMIRGTWVSQNYQVWIDALNNPVELTIHSPYDYAYYTHPVVDTGETVTVHAVERVGDQEFSHWHFMSGDLSVADSTKNITNVTLYADSRIAPIYLTVPPVSSSSSSSLSSSSLLLSSSRDSGVLVSSTGESAGGTTGGSTGGSTGGATGGTGVLPSSGSIHQSVGEGSQISSALLLSSSSILHGGGRPGGPSGSGGNSVLSSSEQMLSSESTIAAIRSHSMYRTRSATVLNRTMAKEVFYKGTEKQRMLYFYDINGQRILSVEGRDLNIPSALNELFRVRLIVYMVIVEK